MSEVGVPEGAATFMVGVLSARDYVAVARVQNPAPQPTEQLEVVEVVDAEPLPQEISKVKTDKRRRMENTRVQQLGDNPRKVRSEARSPVTVCRFLERGIHVSYIGSVRVLGYLASVILVFIMLDWSCLPAANSTKFAAGAPKLEQSIELKVVRATLRQALHQMKGERKVRGAGQSRPPKTSGVRAWELEVVKGWSLALSPFRGGRMGWEVLSCWSHLCGTVSPLVPVGGLMVNISGRLLPKGEVNESSP